MEPIYAPAYRVVDGCLLEIRNSRHESFFCSDRSLLKALAKAGLIEPGVHQNTRPLCVGTKQKRVIFLYREKAERIRNAAF